MTTNFDQVEDETAEPHDAVEELRFWLLVILFVCILGAIASCAFTLWGARP